MSVYVAAASSPTEMARAKKWMAALRERGIEVTSAWVENVEAVGNPNPADAPKKDRARWAVEDLAQVRVSRIFWFLVPESAPGRGAYVEMGAALSAGIPTFASGSTAQSIFNAIGREYATDEEAFEQIWAQYATTPLASPVIGRLPVAIAEAMRAAHELEQVRTVLRATADGPVVKREEAGPVPPAVTMDFVRAAERERLAKFADQLAAVRRREMNGDGSYNNSAQAEAHALAKFAERLRADTCRVMSTEVLEDYLGSR
jgi:hypothetical protein